MNIHTLHQCNINQEINIECFDVLLSKQDAIVFYGCCMTHAQKKMLKQRFHSLAIYFLITDNPEMSDINYSDWLQLIRNCNKTLTWQ